jgi:prophage regulatory protein
MKTEEEIRGQITLLTAAGLQARNELNRCTRPNEGGDIILRLSNLNAQIQILEWALQGSAIKKTPPPQIPKTPDNPGSTFLRLPAVRDRVGLSSPTIYRLIAKGEFPKPMTLGPRSAGWRASDIEA